MYRILHHTTNGLHNDACVLKDELDSQTDIITYSELNLVYNAPLNMKRVHIQFFLEHLYESALKYADINIFVPNIEWLNKVDIRILNTNASIHLMAKTLIAYSVLKDRFHHRIHLTLWSSRDMYVSNIPWKFECLHIKGVSRNKQSQLLLDTWLKHPEWPKLHIISHGNESRNGYLRIDLPVNVNKNVTLYQHRIPDDELKKLMNQCMYHICPSYSEGFGHYINEGMSTDATVITTDLAPMNEIVNSQSHLVIPTNVSHDVNLGKGVVLLEKDIEKTVIRVFLEMYSSKNRNIYLERHKQFKIQIKQMLKSI